MRARFPLPQALSALIVALALVFLPTSAAGQTVSLQSPIDHSVDRDSGIKDTELTYEECTADGTIEIPYTAEERDHTLSIWVGDTACDNNEERGRYEGEKRCIDLGEPTGDRIATLRVRDLLRPLNRDGPENERCAAVGDDSVTVFFLLMKGGDSNTASAKVDLTVDFQGPEAPTMKSIGTGEGQLFARWSASDSTDIDGYVVVCEEVGTGSATGGATGTGGQSATGGTAPASGGSAGTAGSGGIAGGTSGGSDAGGTSGGSEPTGGTAEETSTGGRTGGTEDCQAPTLNSGQRPPLGVIFSGTHGKTATFGGSGELENGIEYACGVAGVDAKGNFGPLSTYQCATPEVVTDFFEAYDDAGGQGGGGFCAFGRAPAASALALFGALAALTLALRRTSRENRS